MICSNRVLLRSATGLALMLQVLPAQAADDATLAHIEKEIAALQAELKHVKHSLAQRDQQLREQARTAAPQPSVAAAPASPPGTYAGGSAILPAIPPGYALVPAQPGAAPGTVVLAQQENAPEGKPLPQGSFRIGGVTVSLGGFIEGASIYRTRNENTDIAGNFNSAIPLPYQAAYHESEFRESARQSRLGLGAGGDVNDEVHVSAYYETDFQGGSPTANSNESNSYTLRLRQAYAQVDEKAWGLHFDAGQAWSLITLEKSGILPRQEDLPYGIDAQYVVGFDWTRQVQFRIAKSFADDKLWFAVSAEEPQSVYYTGPNGLAPKSTGTVNITNPGVGAFASTVNYSDDIAPDVIVKAAADPGWGHYEIEGLLRFLHDRVSQVGSGNNNTALAGGGGAGMLVPIVPKMLTFRASALAGDGIGRYGSAQLPDAVVGRDGSPDPLPEIEALVGLEAHLGPRVDLYAYGGSEQIGRRNFVSGGKGYGYGSPLYDNAGCNIELDPAADCVANTRAVDEGTGGIWWRPIKGPYGTVQVGAQYEYLRRENFSGTTKAPSVANNVVLFSFRYYPFGT